LKPFALQDAGADDAENLVVHGTVAGHDHAETAPDVLLFHLAGGEQGFDFLHRGLEHIAQQAGLELFKKIAHEQQGVHFAGGEPDAGELVARAFSGLAARAGRRLAVAVSAAFPVVVYRGVQAVPHELEIPLDGGAADLEFFHHPLQGNRPAALEHFVNQANSFHLAHGNPRKTERIEPILYQNPRRGGTTI